MDESNEIILQKSKRLTSVVWNYFERVRKADVCYAVCIQCNKKLSGSSNSGTTHLRNHLMRCLKRTNHDMSQLLTPKRKKKENPVTLATPISFDEGQQKDEYLRPKFDQEQHRRDEVVLSRGSGGRFSQERSQVDLARMIIMHGYPLAMVDHVGFKVFARNLQPLFEVVPNSTVEDSCMEIYMREKQRVQHTLNNLYGKINLSVEMWSSRDGANYVCLASHYIDEEWRLHRNVLNFITLDPSHTEDMLSEVIIRCLIEWRLESKLFAVTFDSFSVNEEIVLRIKDHMSQSSQILINGQLLELKSAAHLLSSLVQDCLEAMRDVIQKIRASVRYVKSSQSTQVRFNEIAQLAGINSHKLLVLDSLGNSNSTYVMLETVLEYKGAFCHLRDHDHAFDSSLTDEEWEWTRYVTSYLKLVFDIASDFSRNKFPTANVYFVEMCDFHIQLIEWCKNQDNFLSSLAANMKTKFDEYWNKCSLVLAIAAILDPRFKMKLVEYYYSKIYGSTALDRIKEVSNGVKELLDAYSMCSSIVGEDSSFSGSGLGRAMDTRDRLKGFDKFLRETSQNLNTTSDLDKYLSEPMFPRTGEFNILNYWKVHTPRYPVLSLLARDILGTPMSILAPDSTFNSGTPMIADSQSSLNPDIRQALFCAHDWLSTETEETLPLSRQYALPA
ncbi:PREDICTED: zinc finger BED domain-containing protein RICESLEEPER 1-like isoform X2 [Camelina sativa]|uniref:Zinc finger BED domain-containing protein RICESLEEPER 1-like isoform X2 n=1 Tax=Camelina sativa TaxID=90675 RepID=A0ABM0W417_CAMSA|nr:PREDICTED: zinc finger BED domain-containing protein RICESLEEPER 1-like isoform X2 [Camelina sativa]XP_010465391.1 PREDICTED: zinc finger BED domain-containing protein RICESLEEPER 1-like isoform X2 [Camelina sativa]